MIINFILPFFTKVPGGGTKIMYEYANRMAALGHDIVIYHLVDTPYFNYSRPKFLRNLVNLMIYKNCPKTDWFHFNSNIKLKFADSLHNQYIRDADATITTWWSLVEPLNNLHASKGKKINLIQGIETWAGNEDLCLESYKFPRVNKIGISPFIIDEVKKIDGNISYIPNAVDEKYFTLLNQFSKRKELTFLMLYSEEEVKASSIGIEAFKILKEKYKNISLTLFGTIPRPEKLPSWMKYLQNPKNLNEIYNEHKYFVTNSISEGWGLPAHEAMACGCILICTNIKGYQQFYSQFKGVFTYESSNISSLVDTIEKVLTISDENQVKLSANNQSINDLYSWDNAVRKLKFIIENE